MVRRRVAVMFCSACLWLTSAIAQPKAPLQTLPAQSAFELHLDLAQDDLAKEVERLLASGQDSDAIERCSRHIDGVSNPDSRLLYLRGAAEWQRYLYDLADKDLSRLGSLVPYCDKVSPATYVAEIKRVKALLPPNVYEVKNGNEVVFRVFYRDQDEWTSSIVKALDLAYRMNRAVVDKEVMETEVFLFNNVNDFNAFYGLRNQCSPGIWAWAVGDAGVMYFCQNVPGANVQSQDPTSAYFLTTVVHEFNHALVMQVAGKASMPVWFKEGLATVVQSRASLEITLLLKHRMEHAAAGHAFLPLSEITTQDKFGSNYENYVSKSRQGIDAADPYSQSCFMASYFLTLIPVGGLQDFLEDLAQQRDFEVMFQKHTHLTSEEFYRQWLKQFSVQLKGIGVGGIE